MIRKALRLYHTLRHLRWEQFEYRLRARFARPSIRIQACPSLRPSFPAMTDAPFSESSLVADRTFRFLGETHEVDMQAWDVPGASDLWRYNLHYFDDLNATGAEERISFHRELILNWIHADLPLNHVAWAPYPSSLRIANWIKWLVRHPEQVSTDAVFSLARQADVLEQRIEYHLLGNHLFENARALVFAGTFFQGEEAERWLTSGLYILHRELDEQFLADGGHFELSPMYQATMLWGLLDLLELASSGVDARLSSCLDVWTDVFHKGLDWLGTMTFPDGGIAFFNDAAFGIAPTLVALRTRAGMIPGALPADKGIAAGGMAVVKDLPQSGYARVEWGGATLIMDMACIGPDYLPGHAHADTLSFELALGRNRLFVNSGTSCYGTGPERQRQRGTAAHNTVTVDGENSSDVWAGFRVGRRAYPEQRSVMHDDSGIALSCAHNGFMHLPGKVRHSRSWLCTRHGLVVEDVLSGEFVDAISRLLLHPEWVAVASDRQSANLLHRPSGQRALVRIDGGVLKLNTFSWHPRFGESVETTCLIIAFEGDRLRQCIEW